MIFKSKRTVNFKKEEEKVLKINLKHHFPIFKIKNKIGRKIGSKSKNNFFPYFRFKLYRNKKFLKIIKYNLLN